MALRKGNKVEWDPCLLAGDQEWCTDCDQCGQKAEDGTYKGRILKVSDDGINVLVVPRGEASYVLLDIERIRKCK
jgi:hypothetical protein